MAEDVDNDYSGLEISVPPFPTAERVGGWWRRRWDFVVPEAQGRFRLPPPLGDSSDLHAITCCWWESQTRMVLELHTVDEVLGGDELTYVSVVAAWLGNCFRGVDILVNGVKNHPLLRMSYISPETERWLIEQGYGVESS